MGNPGFSAGQLGWIYEVPHKLGVLSVNTNINSHEPLATRSRRKHTEAWSNTSWGAKNQKKTRGCACQLGWVYEVLRRSDAWKMWGDCLNL